MLILTKTYRRIDSDRREFEPAAETDMIRIKLASGKTITVCESLGNDSAVIVEVSDGCAIRHGSQKIFEIQLDD